jgi:hypothetical protein
MNARLVRQLVNFYPQEWRTRYGEEFQSFLETHPANLQTVLNIIGGAMHERVLSLPESVVKTRSEFDFSRYFTPFPYSFGF